MSGSHNRTIYLIADNKASASLSFCSPTGPYTLQKKASIHLPSYQLESRLTPTHSTCSARPHCHCYSLTRTSFYPVQTTPRSPPDPQRSVSDVTKAALITLLPVGPANLISHQNQAAAEFYLQRSFALTLMKVSGFGDITNDLLNRMTHRFSQCLAA